MKLINNHTLRNLKFIILEHNLNASKLGYRLPTTLYKTINLMNSK